MIKKNERGIFLFFLVIVLIVETILMIKDPAANLYVFLGMSVLCLIDTVVSFIRKRPDVWVEVGLTALYIILFCVNLILI